ncbi:M56 family metallopeptidase [Persicitalea jodogahamensis]|uniref:Peptidase M56 domain-containing protein n=1 Tax=Persicitalea jodogahamensis TaxID=402147 RepID=A0A8J3DB56_9BACT|nr:M56 family metallopeptidase [Persicitalea jodogahamensis]GHB78203.1 hypothetical protein GCM10007390_35550 [Persicitalea jodogahamensis]
MTLYLVYLLKLSASLALVGLFYQLVLRRLTFYHWNRWYLMVYSALAFFIPLINLNQVLPPEKLAGIPTMAETRFIASGDAGLSDDSKVQTRSNLNQEIPSQLPILEKSDSGVFIPHLLVACIISGIALLLLRFAFYLISFARIKARSQLVSNADGIKVYHADRKILPFSFGNAIFYNPDLHKASDLEEIMRHELVHVRQRHTLDILFAELLCILNWYNPFAWLIRHAIRQNLEFIADREVLENGTDARTYQFLLLKVAGVPEFRLANQFNFSSLKQRIIMMNRLKSTRIYLVRFLYLIPVTLALLAFFRTELDTFSAKGQLMVPIESSEVEFEYLAGILMDAETGEPIANLALEKTVSKIVKKGINWSSVPIKTLETISTDEDGFYFWKIDVRDQPDGDYVYELKPIGEKYRDISPSVHHSNRRYSYANPNFNIQFVNENGKSGHQDFYRVWNEIEPRGGRVQMESKDAKDLLLKKLPEFVARNRLIVDFKKEYWKPLKIITKFRNGYFNKDRHLLGYEGGLEFYLDGDKVDYEEINREFRGYLIEPAKREYDEAGIRSGIYNKLFYLTFPVFRKPPDQVLLTDQNVEWVQPEDFDLAILEKEPYMLDGFRQTYGTSSNLMPLKSEIKRIAVFKGKLARYYDRKLDKLWWIETRPADEVMERPAFVSR